MTEASSSWRHLGTLVGALVLTALVVTGAVYALGRRLPATSEELFAEIARLNSEGKTGAIWDLMAPEARTDFANTIQGSRDVLRRNDPEKNKAIWQQFKVSFEEFFSLSYKELFIRENAGREQLMEGAKILRKRTDTFNPTDEMITWESAWGDRWVMQARVTEDGWQWVQQIPQSRASSR